MIPKSYKQMHQDYPDLMQAYESFGKAARKVGPLTDREVALVKLAVSIGAGLEGASHSHCRKALEAGCEPDDLRHVALVSAPTIGFSNDDACTQLGRGRPVEEILMTLRLLGALLCGGRSSRMGTDKSSLLHHSGKTFLRHSHDRLADVCERVVVSGARDMDDYFTIVDPVCGRGPAVGIAASVRFASQHDYHACCINPVDMPHLSAGDLRGLRQIWQDSPETMVCAISDGDYRLQPLVAIYPTILAEELASLAESNDRSIYRWIEGRPHATYSLSSRACHNVNSPEDLS